MFSRNGSHIRSRVRSVSCLLIGAVLLLGPLTPFSGVGRAETPRPAQESRKRVSLPTPHSHYDTYKRGDSGLPLLMALLKEFEPEAQQVLLRFALAAGLNEASVNPEVAANLQQNPEVAANLRSSGTWPRRGLPKLQAIVRPQAVALLKKTDWAAHRPVIIELLVHQSGVLKMIPEKWGTIWNPIVHDAMLSFLDRLSDDRLLDKLVGLAMLPPNSTPGDYLLEFVAKVPSLQKLGQIIARNPDLAPEYRAALQGLENGINTMTSRRNCCLHYNRCGQTCAG